MDKLFPILLMLICFYFIWQAIRVNIIHPEEGDELRKIYKDNKNNFKVNSNIKPKNNSEVQCPKCGSTQIQLMKRGWKITTGFIGSSRNERVCMRCKHKF